MGHCEFDNDAKVVVFRFLFSWLFSIGLLPMTHNDADQNVSCGFCFGRFSGAVNQSGP